MEKKNKKKTERVISFELHHFLILNFCEMTFRADLEKAGSDVSKITRLGNHLLLIRCAMVLVGNWC